MSGRSGTTPVDHCQSDASLCGVRDMAGNVWEWTSSVFKPYPYRHDDGRRRSIPPRIA
jgi:formylglycine-generating enzyme required for sulfatase activity